MKVEIEDGRLIVTPITEEDSRIIYALAAAYAAFDAVCYPIRCLVAEDGESRLRVAGPPSGGGRFRPSPRSRPTSAHSQERAEVGFSYNGLQRHTGIRRDTY